MSAALRDAIEAASRVSRTAVMHVGAANYAEREREALEWVSVAFETLRVAALADSATAAPENPPPKGYASWYDAAVDERVRRVKAERELKAATPPTPAEPVPETDKEFIRRMNQALHNKGAGGILTVGSSELTDERIVEAIETAGIPVEDVEQAFALFRLGFEERAGSGEPLQALTNEQVDYLWVKRDLTRNAIPQWLKDFARAILAASTTAEGSKP